MASHTARDSIRKAEQRPSVYVVYPAALLDGWEVVREHDDDPVSFETREEAALYARAQAVMEGGAVIRLEDWYGNTESVWKAQPETGRSVALTTS
jgi:hypothetical protein